VSSLLTPSGSILVFIFQLLAYVKEHEADTEPNIRVLSELKAALRTQPIKWAVGGGWMEWVEVTSL